MTKERTFGIIKPQAIKNGHLGHILTLYEEKGFKVIGLRMLHLSREQAGEFDGVHKGKPFYERLIEYMTSGCCVVLVLEKENAVEDNRKFIGATDPAKSAIGTIRKMYGTSVEANAIHGADSKENAKREIEFFFSEDELSDC